MNNLINKELIKKRFEKSLPTYEKNAAIQKKMAEILLKKLTDLNGNKFNNILEIGCGTGFLTQGLVQNFTFEELFINDIVDSALNNAIRFSDKIKRIYGDCEKIAFPDNLDLLVSNATFQWVYDIESQFKKAYSCLCKDGIIAFSTFDKENFHQIKSITGKSLNYIDKNVIEGFLSNNFEVIYSNSEIINLEFESAIDILNHLKLSGTNALEATNWVKKDLNEFIEKYNQFKNKNGKFELTYEPLYFIAIKRS